MTQKKLFFVFFICSSAEQIINIAWYEQGSHNRFLAPTRKTRTAQGRKRPEDSRRAAEKKAAKRSSAAKTKIKKVYKSKIPPLRRQRSAI